MINQFIHHHKNKCFPKRYNDPVKFIVTWYQIFIHSRKW